MISYKWFLSPLRVIPLVFGIQWLLWIFLPDTPVTPLGEPKYYGLHSLLLFFTYFCSLMFGIWLGTKAITHRTSCSVGVSTKKQHFLYGVAVVAFWVSFCAHFIRFFDFLDLAALLTILEPGGINRLHSQITGESPFGVASLGTLWILAVVVFAQLRFAPDIMVALKRRSGRYLWASAALVIFISVFGMTRIALLSFVFILLGAFFLIRKPAAVRVGKIFILIIILIVFVWAGSLIRTGILMSAEWGLPLMSPEVQSFVWSEIFERYLGAELNHALIMMSYPTDVSSNWAYGTMLHRFTQAYSPPRFLNTVNILGLWYWQFGILGGMLVSLIIGFWLGMLYRRGCVNHCGLSWDSCYFLIAYPGFFGMTRINYFFLWDFVVPYLVLFSVHVMWTVLLSTSAYSSKNLAQKKSIDITEKGYPVL